MKILLLTTGLLVAQLVHAQVPCSGGKYREFDFWIGEWEVYGKNGNKAGDSKISLILDSCIVLEEWKSANAMKGIYYSGKSFNTYNRATGQWQQTWVDNVGGSTAFLKGSFANKKMEFLTHPFSFSRDTMAIRRLSFYSLGPDKVRQHGEISKDNGVSWATEYDLEYRKKSQ
jgi:hypothetical protein